MILPTKELREALARVALAVSKSSFIPVLDHVMIESKGTNVTITASNLADTITASFEAIDPSNEVILPYYKDLYDLVKMEQSPSIQLVEDNGSIEIKVGTSTGRINGEDPTAWPSLPEIKGGEFEINSLLFGMMKDKLLPFSSTDELRPHMNGINFRSKGEQLILEATDSQSLARLTIDKQVEEIDVLLRRNIVSIAANLFSEEETLLVRQDGKKVEITGREAVYIGNLLEEKFPDTEGALQHFVDPSIANVESYSLQAELSKALIFANKKSSQVELTFDSRELEVRAIDVAYDKNYHNKIGCEGSERLEIKFDATNLLKSVSQFSEEIRIQHFRAPNKPIIIEEGNYLVLTMPMGKVG